MEHDLIKNQCKIYGLFKTDTTKKLRLADGYFEYVIDINNGSTISKKINFFSQDVINKLTPESNHNIWGKEKDELSDSSLSFKFANGTYVTVYNRYEYATTTSMSRPVGMGSVATGGAFIGGGISTGTYTIYKDIYIMAVDKDGKFLWVQKIDRKNEENEATTLLNENKHASIFYLKKKKRIFNYTFDDEGNSAEEELDSKLKSMYYLNNIFRISENESLCMLHIGGQKYCLTKVSFK